MEQRPRREEEERRGEERNAVPVYSVSEIKTALVV
jgi:hypothetical protein